MYSWSGIGVPTTKAIIRESARLVNLTLGRAGFFFVPQIPTRRATSEQMGVSLGVRTTLSRKSRTGSIF